jgi:hypothetical protein
MADHMTGVNRLQNLLDFFRTKRRRLGFGPREFGRFDLPGRVDRQNAFLGHPRKHHPDRGHVLLDRRS